MSPFDLKISDDGLQTNFVWFKIPIYSIKPFDHSKEKEILS